MTPKTEWATIKHSIRRHPKLVKAGPESAWLFVCLFTYCDEFRTDGNVDDDLVDSIAVAGGVKPRAVKPAIERLRGVGLVCKTLGGWHVHDYLEHQLSRAEHERQRELAAKRKREQRERDRQALRNGTSRVTRGVTRA